MESTAINNSVSHTPGFALRREPIPSGERRARGKWPAVVVAAREAAKSGECIAFDCSPTESASARANLYNNRGLLPGERVRISYREGVLRVWIIKAEGRP